MALRPPPRTTSTTSLQVQTPKNRANGDEQTTWYKVAGVKGEASSWASSQPALPSMSRSRSAPTLANLRKRDTTSISTQRQGSRRTTGLPGGGLQTAPKQIPQPSLQTLARPPPQAHIIAISFDEVSLQPSHMRASEPAIQVSSSAPSGRAQPPTATSLTAPSPKPLHVADPIFLDVLSKPGQQAPLPPWRC